MKQVIGSSLDAAIRRQRPFLERFHALFDFVAVDLSSWTRWRRVARRRGMGSASGTAEQDRAALACIVERNFDPFEVKPFPGGI